MNITMTNQWKRYRKKPVFVEAVQFDPQSRPWPDCVKPWAGSGLPVPRDMSFGYIDSDEGKLHVMARDWIIKNAQGFIFPYHGDILEDYEAADG